MAVMCMAVLSIVKVRNKISAYLVIALLVIFPTLAYSYGYLFDSVLYAFSLMFAALAVWMTNKWKYGWLGGGYFSSILFGAIPGVDSVCGYACYCTSHT